MADALGRPVHVEKWPGFVEDTGAHTRRFAVGMVALGRYVVAPRDPESDFIFGLLGRGRESDDE